MTFSSPIAAFGFYAADIGDFVGPITLTFADGGASTVNIGNTVNQLGGSAIFFGYIDVDNPFTSVSFGVLFGNEAGSTEFFGLDDLTVGSVAQVTPVSEPVSIALFGSGLIGLFMLRRQHRLTFASWRGPTQHFSGQRAKRGILDPHSRSSSL